MLHRYLSLVRRWVGDIGLKAMALDLVSFVNSSTDILIFFYYVSCVDGRGGIHISDPV